MHPRAPHRRQERTRESSPPDFGLLLDRELAREPSTGFSPIPPECHSIQGTKCTLCHASVLTYERETNLKTRTLEHYLRRLVQCPVLPLVVSPRGRAYRTITKRKVFHGRDGARLGLIDADKRGAGGCFEVGTCAI